MQTPSNPVLSRRSFVAATAAALGALSLPAGLAVAKDGKTDAKASASDAKDAKTAKPAADLDLVTKGTLTVGSDCDYPPFIWMDGEKPQGFEFDLMTAVCDELGLELKYLPPQKFDTLIPSIIAGGKMDVAVSSVTVTDKRLEEVDFTEPYCDSNQSIAVMKESGFEDEEDLAGKIVAVHSGTTGEEWAKENLTSSTVVPYDDQSSAFAALAAGKADAFCEDLPIAQYMIAQAYPECELLVEIPTGEQYAIAVSQDNPNLTEALNEALATIVENGTYDELYAKYFEAQD